MIRCAAWLVSAALAGLLTARAAPAAPPDEAADAEPVHHIQDNSFLVEEAYNQDPGVVQHITQFTRERGSGDWMLTFTQEWPAGGLRHQLSYTVPVASADGRRGVGDVALNYRYQLVGDSKARVAVAPRLSLFLPTGAYRRGLGAGAPTYQIDVPVSTLLSRSWIAHWNAGATWTHSARGADGARANTAAENLAASVIWIGSPILDVLVETAYSRSQSVVGPGRTSWQSSWVLSPGIRWAWEYSSGLQIVPGLAVPIGIGPSRGARQILLYLSFEHPFAPRAARQSAE